MEREVIRFVLPVALADVFDAVAPAFEASAFEGSGFEGSGFEGGGFGRDGLRFETAVMLNPDVPAHIARGARWSLAASNPCHLRTIAQAGGCDGGPRDLGLSPLALAVRGKGDAPREDLDAVAAVLRHARRVAVTRGGTSGARFARLVKHLGMDEALRSKIRPMPGGGPMAALLAGTVDVAALPLTNVAPVPGVRAAALCPLDLDLHVDLALCVHADAGPGARRFADRLVDADMDRTLAALGLWRREASARMVAPRMAAAHVATSGGPR